MSGSQFTVDEPFPENQTRTLVAPLPYPVTVTGLPEFTRAFAYGGTAAGDVIVGGLMA